MQHADDMVMNCDPGELPAHIAKFLDGAEWDSSTVEAIADLLRWNGYYIGDPEILSA